MCTLTQPLHDEHRQFAGPLNTIHRAAENMGDGSLSEIRSQVDAVYAFLVESFIPHARAEEAVYPLVDHVIGAPQASDPMIREHAEVYRLAEKLRALRDRLVFGYFGPSQLSSMREVLYDLNAILKLHLAQENETYSPTLEMRITAAEPIDMTEELESVKNGATALAAVAAS